jgi:hypothetical protein
MDDRLRIRRRLNYRFRSGLRLRFGEIEVFGYGSNRLIGHIAGRSPDQGRVLIQVEDVFIPRPFPCLVQALVPARPQLRQNRRPHRRHVFIARSPAQPAPDRRTGHRDRLRRSSSSAALSNSGSSPEASASGPRQQQLGLRLIIGNDLANGRQNLFHGRFGIRARLGHCAPVPKTQGSGCAHR